MPKMIINFGEVYVYWEHRDENLCNGCCAFRDDDGIKSCVFGFPLTRSGRTNYIRPPECKTAIKGEIYKMEKIRGQVYGIDLGKLIQALSFDEVSNLAIVFRKLLAYQKTGVSPERVAQWKAERDAHDSLYKAQ